MDAAPMGYNQSPSGYITTEAATASPATAFEVHMMEKGAQITKLILRQLGIALEAAPRVPKMKDPPLYNGEDDDALFMSWLGSLCTYLEGYSMGGPKYDMHRVLYLKQALGSDALRWFRSEVDPTNRESDIPREFDPIVRAMYQRFVTSSTAIRATKEYEAVRFDPARGIELLVSELRRTVGDMREPPSEFSMRQRFMRLIPIDVHNKLIRRGLFPEYTEMATLKNHARTTIEGKELMRGGAASNAAPGAASARATQTGKARSGTTCAPVRSSIAQAPALTSRPATSTYARAPTATPRAGPVIGPTLKSSKTCFGCGIVGHISSDPVCPKYNESASHRPRPVAQLHAQRVVTSYVSGQQGDTEQDELEYLDEPEAQDPEEFEGLYDNYEGSQYNDEGLDDYPTDNEDNDELDDPNVAPDLEDLTDKEGEPEVRSGAMRVRQHYSLRVEPTEDAVGEETRPTTTTSAPPNVRYTILDAGRVDAQNAGYPDWSAASEATLDPVSRISTYTHEGLLDEFNVRHGPGPYYGPTTLELSVITAIGAEEGAGGHWMSVVNQQPTMLIGYSTAYLRTTAVDLNRLDRNFRQLKCGLIDTLQDLAEVIRLRNAAREHITGLHDRPSGSSPRIPELLQATAAHNSRLIEDVTMSICLFEHWLEWARNMLNSIGDELTFRLLAREDHARQQGPGIEVERAASLAATSPPASAPPSYPGSPHVSDDFYAADERLTLSRVPQFDTPASPEPEGDVVMIPDSPESEEIEVDAAEAPLPLPQPLLPEVILRSVLVHTSTNAERLTTYVDPDGQLRVETSELPATHPRHPIFREHHRSALRTAIYERALERGTLSNEMRDWVDEQSQPERDAAGDIIRDMDGFPDRAPNLFPGLAYHEGLASRGPDEDNVDAWPGFWAQMLSNRVEHLATHWWKPGLPPGRARDVRSDWLVLTRAMSGSIAPDRRWKK
ncbi:hypothetical protein DFH06DRAFT_1151878 [Mycena polygramma]|nr:hypothetical protein DFH06DRAFT_1151878 [Mycena polygramma]